MALTFSGMMVAPTTIASQYLSQAWRGAVILSFVWFLHRWKTNIFTRALTSQSLERLDREKMLTLDKVSSVGLFFIGIMALAEACGVAVQSILTVGGIGGQYFCFSFINVDMKDLKFLKLIKLLCFANFHLNITFYIIVNSVQKRKKNCSLLMHSLFCNQF